MFETNTLYIGSKFTGHDSAIFVIFPEEKDIFALETERVTRYKHDSIYPVPAIMKLLEYKKINRKKIKKIYFSNAVYSQKNEKVIKNDHDVTIAHRRHFNSKYVNEFIESNLAFSELNGPGKFLNLIKSYSGLKILWHVLIKKIGLNITQTLDESIVGHLRKLFPNAEVKIDYFDHQLCHAISSYYTSGFDNALLITSDGFGDDKFSSVFTAHNGKISHLYSSETKNINLKYKNQTQTLGLSTGIVYSFFTELLGFRSDSDEGKVEALAAYGNWNNDIYNRLMMNTWVNKKENCICFNHKEIENYLEYNKITKVIERYKREDVAAAVQRYLEDVHVEYIKHIVEITGIKNLCFSGGVAANVILNLNIFENITRNIHIPPAMADDGTAQGAVIHQLLKNGYEYNDLKWMKSRIMPYYSTSYTKKEVIAAIEAFDPGIKYCELGDSWPEEAAKMVADGKIGAIFQGKMEWGPRALGNRSIIADPRRRDFRKIINLSIKKRPEFQPFCPSILSEEKERLFVDSYENKHMTCAFRMKKNYQKELPSAIHVDGTSRAQFVEEGDNSNYYRLLKKVKELTGYGVVINTSFNKHGRTIVETPTNALTDFYDTDLDFLIIEGILIKK